VESPEGRIAFAITVLGQILTSSTYVAETTGAEAGLVRGPSPQTTT